MDLRWDWIAAVLAAILLLGLVYRRDHRRRYGARAALLNEVRGLLSEATLSFDALRFPRLEGAFDGRRVKLELLLESLAVRKLPALWLLVTVYGGSRFGGTLDALARPGGTEFFSPSDSLDHRLPPPTGWPQHAAIRSDQPEAMPPAELITPHMTFFDDPRAKELLVTPKGVRLVYLAKETERAHYLVLRDAELGTFQVPAAMARDLLVRAVKLRDQLL